MRKTRSSTKIAIAFVVLAAAAYFGYGFVSGLIVDSKKFPPLAPGEFNLVGVDTSLGYYIVVANQVAQLVRGHSGEFRPGDHDEGDTSSEKKRVPIREMLQSLQGNEKALGKFVMSMNDMSDAEFPAYPTVWKAEDIEKAVAGDTPLKNKLESDLNVHMDGKPIDRVRIGALEEGILIDSPVSIRVPVGAEPRMLHARIQEQFIPRFCREVWNQIGKKPNLNSATIAGYYRAEAQRILADPAQLEDVKASLLGRIAPNRLNSFAAVPKSILDSTTIIVNDGLVEGARYDKYRTSDGKELFDLVLQLSDEGRMRLWQYSKRHPNSQLLVTWQGIAIAAPRIQGELPLSEVVVKQLSDEGLVRDAVEAIKNSKRNP